MKTSKTTQILYMEYSPNFYNICIEKIGIHLTTQICIHLIYFSFGEYAFSSFQIEINHMICTKVKNTSPTFGMNFSNHKLALLEHNFFAKPIIYRGIEPQVLSKTLPNAS